MPLVEITIIEGRTSAQKSALITQVTDAVENAISAPRQAAQAEKKTPT